ncbi:MAG: glycosyltransferase [Anaerolineae bacterium]
MRLIYIANMRVPTEKAHGLQIFQNAEAFAQTGAHVSLWAARRVNTPEMNAIRDPFEHYGVARNFKLRLLPTIDLLWRVPGRDDGMARIVFAVQWLTFTLAVLISALFTRAEVFYTRDPLILCVCSMIKPRRALAYEPHTASTGRMGKMLQRMALRRAGAVFPVTRKLADDLITEGANPDRLWVAPDGVQAGRFANLPDRQSARESLNWPPDAFIVGYVGRLHTMNMDKGVSAVLEAVLQVPGASLALVGGPEESANALREEWLRRGGAAEQFLMAGQVPPAQVPVYLRAFDVCTMMLPFTPHFAYYASPLKLFEYMAAGRAIVASDFPAYREIVTDGESALLVAPGDPAVLAEAIRRLQADPGLRRRLGINAQREAMTRYTWSARAQLIMKYLA